MHPLLLQFGPYHIGTFQLGPIQLHTYGLMIVIGFLAGLYLIYKQAKKEGLNGDRIIDLAFWSLLWGLAGGRIVYILTMLPEFSRDPISIFYIWKGGLVFYGGFLGGFAAFWYFSKQYKLPFLQTVDIGVPSLAIAHFFGRLGCFAAGCCFGKKTDVPWAVIFRDPLSIAPQGEPLHPTQLYDALNALIIFSICMFVLKRKKFNGQVLLVYMLVYSIGRSIVEIYRGDSIRGFVIDEWLSTSQFISILIFATAAFLWFKWKAKYPVHKRKA